MAGAGKRIALITITTAIVCVVIGLYIGLYLTNVPGSAAATTTFTFRTPGKGLYRWQCFVPCAAGYIAGFGGPMQTVGYMDGFMKVV